MMNIDEQRETERRERVRRMMKRLAEPVKGLVCRDGVWMAESTPPWWEPESDGYRQKSLFPETATPTG